MNSLRQPMKYLIAPGLSAALLAIVLWNTSGSSTHVLAQDSNQQREDAALAFSGALVQRANDGEGGATEEVLVSFTRGMAVANAVELLKSAAPGIRLLSATLSTLDSSGTEHTVGIMIRPGEDPTEKLIEFSNGMIGQLASQASEKLSCVAGQAQDCQAPDARSAIGLRAASALTGESLRVYGVVVSGTVAELALLVNHPGGEILSLEPSAGSPLRSPILNAKSEGN